MKEVEHRLIPPRVYWSVMSVILGQAIILAGTGIWVVSSLQSGQEHLKEALVTHAEIPAHSDVKQDLARLAVLTRQIEARLIRLESATDRFLK